VLLSCFEFFQQSNRCYLTTSYKPTDEFECQSVDPCVKIIGPPLSACVQICLLSRAK
jgi:hypothetical protein